MKGPGPCLAIAFFALLLLFASACDPVRSRNLGINYGRVANNLPSPQRAIALIRTTRIRKVKIFDADEEVLRALSHTGLDVTITLPDEQIYDFGRRPTLAYEWVKQSVVPYVTSGTRITTICVGNEVLINVKATGRKTPDQLLPAMRNIQAALVHYGVDKRIRVSTPHALNVLSNSYPPSAGTFNPDLIQYIQPMLEFLNETSAPFMVSIYPYFAYRDNKKDINITYALFQNNSGVLDSQTKLHYTNLLYAQIDSVYAALENAGFPNMQVLVAEVGWPSGGSSSTEPDANPANARRFNRGVISRVLAGEGTPLRPHIPLEVFIFSLFDENQKQGLESEQHYGLFRANMSRNYDCGVQPGYFKHLTLS